MRNNLRRLFSLIICFAVIVSLSACGNGQPSTADSKPISTESSPADSDDQYIYKSHFSEISLTSDSVSLLPILYTEAGFYATCSEMSFGQSTGGVSSEASGIPVPVYSNVLYFVDQAGKAEKLPNFQPLVPDNDELGRSSFTSNVAINHAATNPDGNIVALIEHNNSWFDGPESAMNTDEMWNYFQNEQTYQITEFAKDGSLISIADVDLGTSGGFLNSSNSLCDSDGNYLTIMDMSILAISPDGKIQYTITGDRYFNNMLQLSDGSIAVLVYDTDILELIPIDLSSKKLGDAIVLPKEAWNVIAGNSNYDLFYTADDTLFAFNRNSEAPIPVLNWHDHDINSDTIDTSSLRISENGDINGLLWDYSGNIPKTLMFTLTRVSADSLSETQNITLGLCYSDDMITNFVSRFNRIHDDIHIDIKEYSTGGPEAESDISLGAESLIADLKAGSDIDIISLSGLSYRSLASQNLLADLYPFIDADPEINRTDFFPSVLAASEINGSLYLAAYQFYVQALAGPASIVGTSPGWTFDDFDAAFLKMPQGSTILDPLYSRDMVLNAVLPSNIDLFVNRSTGEVNFKTEEFRQLLDFANRFPSEPDWSVVGQQSESAASRIREGTQMLTQYNLSSLESFMTNDLSLGSTVTLIGWPSTSGVGNSMELDHAFAICQNSVSKEAAWEFLRLLLTEGGQANTYMIPTNKNVFDRKLNELMEVKYMTDPNGMIIQNDKGENIAVSRGTWVDENGETHQIHAMTQEQADKILEIIDNCTRIPDHDPAINDIVKKEVQTYFDNPSEFDEICRKINESVLSLISANH